MTRTVVLTGVAVLVVVAAAAFWIGFLGAGGDALAERGAALFQEGDYDAAVEKLEAALAQGLERESEKEVLTVLGNAYGELEQYDEAIARHEKALALDPTFHTAWVNLGIVHRMRGAYDDAERCYREALALNPDYPELHASIGALYIHQAKYDEAVQHLERAVDIDESLPVSWGNLALAYASVGRFDDADAALERAAVLGYRSAAIVRERIDTLRSLSD